MKPTRTRHTPEFKKEAVALVTEKGHGYSEAAALLHINVGMLRRWAKELQLNGEQAFPGKGHQSAELEEVARLKRELRRAQMEIDILIPRGHKKKPQRTSPGKHCEVRIH